MNVFNFGSGSGSVDSETAYAIAAIANTHGVSFFHADMPDGPRYWFEKPCQGQPFDRDTERAVIGALTAAGLWPIAQR